MRCVVTLKDGGAVERAMGALAGYRYTASGGDRTQIFGAGVGHHSPTGGYLEAEDLVFVLDVNSDYQPWLVERKRLFAAVNTFDGDKKRGLLIE